MFFYEQQQSDVRLEKSLDKDLYNEADLLTLKVPLSLPYLSANTQFERVDGEIKVRGKIYKYVKRRILEGQLVLLCLPDYNKMKLQSEANDSYKNENNLPASASKKSQDSKSASYKNILSEYNQSEIDYTAVIYSICASHRFQKALCKIISFPRIAVEQPPEVV